MKTKTAIKIFAMLLAVISINLTSCKKDKEVAEPDTTSLQQLSKDQENVESSSDDVLNDVNTVLSNGSKKSGQSLPCNVTVDSSVVIGDTIIYSITYNGLNCSQTRTKYGNATVKRNINTHWGQAGTTVTVEYLNVIVTKVSNGKTVTMNGTRKFENYSGGYLADLGTTLTSITHKITGQMTVTFEDNTSKTWNISRQRTFTGTLNQLVVTTDGLGTADGFSNLVTWGINRHGEAFYSQITQSIVCKQLCEWNPTSGTLIHQIPSDSKSATQIYGYDNNNQLITTGDCPTKYRLDWQKKNHSGSLFLQL